MQKRLHVGGYKGIEESSWLYVPYVQLQVKRISLHVFHLKQADHPLGKDQKPIRHTLALRHPTKRIARGRLPWNKLRLVTPQRQLGLMVETICVKCGELYDEMERIYAGFCIAAFLQPFWLSLKQRGRCPPNADLGMLYYLQWVGFVDAGRLSAYGSRGALPAVSHPLFRR